MNYTYDNDSRLTQVSDPTGTYQFTFDNMGRLTGTITSYAFLTGRNFTTGYGYDAASSRTSFTDPESGSTAYVYDTLNRLQTLTPPAAISGGSFGFGYDALSRRTSLTRPNSVNTSYSYDNLSHLLSVTHTRGGVTLDGATYTVDNAGNRNSKADLYAGVTTNYGYDNIYELLSATQGASTTESYTYDPVGNRLSNLSGSGWSNNTSNELASRPGVTYIYDNNGNTTSKTDSTGIANYTWDFENRLTSLALPGNGGTVSFKYDPFGRRIYKSSSGGTSIYAYDGHNLVEETNSSGTAVARYSQRLNIDEPLVMLRSGTTSYYETDGLGSVTSLSGTAGAIANNYTYDSFGNPVASTGTIQNSFRYTAREFDTETSLYYYRARYYDPSTGRFLNEDPLGYGGGINFYRYASDNPVSLKDPFGLTVTVNYWPSSGIPGTSNFNYGHVSMSVDGPDGQAYISWMPAEVGPTGTVPNDLLNATIAVGLAQDSAGEGRAPLQVAINGLDEKAILDWWKKYKKDPRFNLVGRNCATTVRDALTSGGAQLPFDNWPFPRNIYDYAIDIKDSGPNGPINKLAGSLE